MNKSTPITSRIQKRSIGGIVQPAIEGMGSVAKMDNKMHNSPAKNYKAGYYKSPAKVDKNTVNSQNFVGEYTLKNYPITENDKNWPLVSASPQAYFENDSQNLSVFNYSLTVILGIISCYRNT